MVKADWGATLAREQGLTIISTRAKDSEFSTMLEVLKVSLRAVHFCWRWSGMCTMRETADPLRDVWVRQKEHAQKSVSGVKMHNSVRRTAQDFLKRFRSCLARETKATYDGGRAPTSGLLGITFLAGTRLGSKDLH